MVPSLACMGIRARRSGGSVDVASLRRRVHPCAGRDAASMRAFGGDNLQPVAGFSPPRDQTCKPAPAARAALP